MPALTAPAAPPYTVAIVEDHPVIRAGLEKVISESAALSVVATADRLSELDPAAGYDVLLLGLPDADDAPALRAAEAAVGRRRAVVSSSWSAPPSLATMIRAGARGYLTPRSAVCVVTTALAAVASGGLYVCPDLADRFSRDLARGADDDTMGLSPREVQTLRGIADGLTHAQIARRLGLTEATVNTYTKRIRAKLNAGNKAELTRIAIELGHVGSRRWPAA